MNEPLTYCPHCDEQNYDLIETTAGERGCTLCIDRCPICGENHYIENMTDMYVHIHALDPFDYRRNLYKHRRWLLFPVCAKCKQNYEDYPADFADMCAENPEQDLFDILHQALKP